MKNGATHADRRGAPGREGARGGARLVVERLDRLEHAHAGGPADRRRVVQHPRDGADAHAGQCRDARDRAHFAPSAIGLPSSTVEAVPSKQGGVEVSTGAVRKLPRHGGRRSGGATACSTRSIRARSRTPTATAIGDLPRDHGAPRPPRVARDRRHLAQPDDALAERRLGLRRRRLLRRRIPALGTLEDLDELIAEAGRRGIRVLLDLVPNHTSDRHAWFQDALGGRDARHRDFYVWADPKPDGSPPNNWVSSFGGPAWTLDEALRPVLPAQLPADPARPELVERGRARRVRRDPALLVRPRDRGLAHRRHPRHRQGPRAARRPGGDRGRPPAHPGAREQAGVLDEPARGPRRPAALARDRRRPTTRSGSSWGRPTCSTSSS